MARVGLTDEFNIKWNVGAPSAAKGLFCVWDSEVLDEPSGSYGLAQQSQTLLSFHYFGSMANPFGLVHSSE